MHWKTKLEKALTKVYNFVSVNILCIMTVFIIFAVLFVLD